MRLFEEIEKELDEYIAMKDAKEQKILNRQLNNGLRMIARWETLFKETNKGRFEYMLELQLPCWKKWITKYKWVAPSIPACLDEIWEGYQHFKNVVKEKDDLF